MKNQILAEIRRTAAENAGKPLGKKRFEAATGVSESDWLGRYWLRWSEALAEAGFPPNRLQARLPDEAILEPLAALVAELGRFPVSAELRMKARETPEFPSHNTFRRFGGKSALAARLLAYCATRGEYREVAEICEPLVGDRREPEAQGEEPETGFGFIYLLRSGRFYKIGRTNAVGRREYELSIQLPEKATVLHYIRTDDPIGMERYWHGRFAERRRNGEWFALTAADVKAFRRRKVM